MSDYAIHPTAAIIDEVDSMLSRTRALLAPAQPVLRILVNIDPLAKLAAKRCMASCDFIRQCPNLKSNILQITRFQARPDQNVF